MKRFFLILGGLLLLDTAIIATRSNFNLGVILPGCLGLPLLLLGLFYRHTLAGPGRVVRIALLTVYVLGCIILLVCGILMFSAAHRKTDKADALIVLGAALHGEKVTWVLSNRLDTAAEYLTEHPGCVCITSGGQGAGESLPEGEAMRNYLIRKGIAEERILAETKSTSTRENFTFSKAMIDELLGPDASVAFVTNDFHVYRAGKTAKSLGIDAVGVAAPDVWYLRLNNFLRESVGICWYTLTGKI